MLKVKLFLFHPHTLFVNGGGESMLKNTLEVLQEKSIDATLFDIFERDEDFDIFHLFGSNNSVAELYTTLSSKNKKLIVSAIDYSNFSHFKLQVLKYIQKYYPIENTYTHRQKLFDYAKVIIANSKSEKQFLLDYFELDEKKIQVVPVGVSSKFNKADSTSFVDSFNIDNYVLCVGRINSRKSQIKIINALKDMDINIVFIGREDPSELEYFKEFEGLVKSNENVFWFGQFESSSDLLVSAFANAKIHLAPSNPPEFPGIVSMEAGMAGTKVVTTTSAAIEETFEDLVYYCESSEESIYKVVNQALKDDNSTKLQEYLYAKFRWEVITEEIIKIYNDVHEGRV